MSAHDEAKSSSEWQHILEAQRRRARIDGWVRFGIGLGFVLVGFSFPSLSNSIGNLVEGEFGAMIKGLSGTASSILWVWVVVWIFRQSATDFARARGRENLQATLPVLEAYKDREGLSVLLTSLAKEAVAGVFDTRPTEKSARSSPSVRRRIEKPKKNLPADSQKLETPSTPEPAACSDQRKTG